MSSDALFTIPTFRNPLLKILDPPLERQITFKPFPGSSRNGQHDIYFHVERNSLIRPFSWYKVGGLNITHNTIGNENIGSPQQSRRELFNEPR